MFQVITSTFSFPGYQFRRHYNAATPGISDRDRRLRRWMVTVTGGSHFTARQLPHIAHQHVVADFVLIDPHQHTIT